MNRKGSSMGTGLKPWTLNQEQSCGYRIIFWQGGWYLLDPDSDPKLEKKKKLGPDFIEGILGIKYQLNLLNSLILILIAFSIIESGVEKYALF